MAPSLDCAPAEVTVRFLAAQFETMAQLHILQRSGELDAVSADRMVWRRLAA